MKKITLILASFEKTAEYLCYAASGKEDSLARTRESNTLAMGVLPKKKNFELRRILKQITISSCKFLFNWKKFSGCWF